MKGRKTVYVTASLFHSFALSLMLTFMTLRDVFQVVSSQPGLLFLLLTAIPAGAFLVNLWSGETAEDIIKWKYVYAGLIYLACIPGIFAVTLNIYLFLFERQSIWDMNLAIQLLPILTMVTTLMLIRRKIPFKYIPGFGKLSSFLTLIAALIGILWFIDRTRIYAISYIPFSYIVIGFIGLLLVIRFTWSRIF
ncbi:hypothetical protein GCM10028805_48550 [Spirosoma harenae]